MTIRVSDGEASERFYTRVFRAIGIEQTWSDEHYATTAPPARDRSTARTTTERFCSTPDGNSAEAVVSFALHDQARHRTRPAAPTSR